MKPTSLFFTCVLPWLAGCTESTPEDLRPNLLFIITDQHNAQSLGCAGNPDVRTPHLDRLASEGVRFSAAFCQTAQCSPSRFTIWTGRYTRSHGVRLNAVHEPLEEVTFPELLQSAGYATASIGKHHMSRSPKVHGFDQVIDMDDFDAAMQSETGRPWHRYVQWSPDFKPDDPARMGISPWTGDKHPAGFWSSKAIEFIRENKQRPFCLWLSYFGPHPPIAPSAEFADLYAPAQLQLPPNFEAIKGRAPKQFERRVNRLYAGLDEQQHRTLLAAYYGLVTQIDHNIGRVLDELEQLGLSERTTVVFTSDHGEMMGEHGLWNKQPLNREGTVRVPLIVRTPEGKQGVVCDELVGLIDLMPTVLEACDQAVPAANQGRSLIPLLKGEDVEWRDVIFSEVPTLNPPGWSLMARSKTRKYLLRRYDNGRRDRQFFDIETDPWERRDRLKSQRYAEDIDELAAALAQWEERTVRGPVLPRDVDIVKAVAGSTVECELQFPDPQSNPFEARLLVRTMKTFEEPIRLLIRPGTEMEWSPGPLVAVDDVALIVPAPIGSEAEATVNLYLKDPPVGPLQTGGPSVPRKADPLIEQLCEMPDVAQSGNAVRQLAIWISNEGDKGSQLKRDSLTQNLGAHPGYRVSKPAWVQAREYVHESRTLSREHAARFNSSLDELNLSDMMPTTSGRPASSFGSEHP